MEQTNNINIPNPFPGLRPFGIEEGHYFFGRKGQSNRLLELLLENKFVAVTGASGSGKSSLIYCGLIPTLYGGYDTSNHKKWKIITTRPGNTPIHNLATALHENIDKKEHKDDLEKNILQAILKRSSNGLIEIINQASPKHDTNYLLIIDQFEELFRYRETRTKKEIEEETHTFIRLLENANLKADLPLYIIITIRSDFIGECSAFSKFTKLINDSSFLIPKMTRQDYKEAIVGPIHVSGANVDQALVEKILNSISSEPDQLPIMQHALMRTWEYWSHNKDFNKPISLADYDTAGTIERAISLHANEAYKELNQEQKQICKRMFQTLAVKGEKNRGIRQPTKLKELADVCNKPLEEVIEVIEAFRQNGRSFLMPEQGIPLKESSVIDLSHESLMRVWDNLKTWVDEENDSVDIYMRLVSASEAYQQGKGGLWKPPDLHTALIWRKTQKPTLAWAKNHHPAFERVKVFLDASEKQHLKEERNKVRLQQKALKRSRLSAMVFGLFALLFMGIMFYAYNQKIEADEARKEADKLRMRAENLKDLESQKRIQFEELAIITADSLEKQKIATQEKTQLFENELQSKIEDVNTALKEKEEIAELSKQVEEQKIQAEQTALKAQQQAERAEQETAANYKKRILAISQSLAVKSQQIRNKNLKALLAQQAYIYNKKYDGPSHHPDLWQAFYDGNVAFKGKNYNGLSGHTGAVRSTEFAPNSNILYSTGTDGKITRRNLSTGGKPEVLYTNTFINRALTISPNGRYLACGTDKYTIQLFDLKSGITDPEIFEGHEGWVWALDFSAKSTQLVSTGSDNKIILWNLLNDSKKVITTHATRIRTISFANDENSFFTGDDNGQIIMWSTTGSKKIIYENPSAIYAIAISNNNRYLAFGDKDGNLTIFDLRTNRLLVNMNVHSARILDVEFSKNNKYIATSSTDGLVKLWPLLEINERPIIITRHEAWVMSIAFSDDEKTLVSSSNRGDLIFYWPTNIDEFAENTCNFVERNLTQVEWNLHIGSDIPYERTCPQLK